MIKNVVGRVRTVFPPVVKVFMMCLHIARAGDDSCGRWYKGQLHTHSYWSDGRGFPEQVIRAYKDRGYHFLSITDHNRFGDSPNEWRPVSESEGGWPPRITRASFERYQQDFGDDWVDTVIKDEVLQVRLKTHEENKKRFEIPGEFLLMPGVEVTLKVGDRDPHLNYINLPELIPLVRHSALIKNVPNLSVSEAIALTARHVSELAEALKLPGLLILNHPFWQSFDILPQDVIDNPCIRFVEINCPHQESPPYTHEQFWDAVNAFRARSGQHLLYAVATDDAHFYDEDRIRRRHAGVDNGWVMVRCDKLTEESLLHAMQRGDFYASSGVYLEDVSFDRREKRLQVTVKPEEGVNYTINFITTKQNFDPSVSWIEQASPSRKIPRYSEDIGRTVKTVPGTEAFYTMDEADLYVRVRVDSDQSAKRIDDADHHPHYQRAWTQPYSLSGTK